MSRTLDVSCIVVGVIYGSILLVSVYSLASSSQCLLLVLASICFSCATRWPSGPPRHWTGKWQRRPVPSQANSPFHLPQHFPTWVDQRQTMDSAGQPKIPYFASLVVWELDFRELNPGAAQIQMERDGNQVIMWYRIGAWLHVTGRRLPGHDAEKEKASEGGTVGQVCQSYQLANLQVGLSAR